MVSTNKGDVSDSAAGQVKPQADEIEGQPVNVQVYQNPKDFASSLTTAVEKQDQKDGAILQRIEGGAAPFQLVADAGFGKPQVDAGADQAGKPVANDAVTSRVEQDGKVVRERTPGGDVVLATDDKGKIHRFPDEKITKLPVDFKSIPDWRVKQITSQADGLIKNYTDPKMPNGRPDGKLSFHDMSSMMKDIGKMDNLTEVEKCRLWTEVRIKMQQKEVPILDADEKEKMIDSWKGSDDPWHALITMNDGYHGNHLINMSEKDASEAIKKHENGGEADKMGFVRGMMWKTAKTVLGVNTGDVEASEGQLRALRELRSKGTFSAYADEWTRQFVRNDRDQYGRPK
ncbi:MAG: hypothetical protein SGJ27_30445 [Candidatus Melainabacteria bacterium]|nr:hypothetical protein [Candidatus Melainabacteria bacterium]